MIEPRMVAPGQWEWPQLEHGPAGLFAREPLPAGTAIPVLEDGPYRHQGVGAFGLAIACWARDSADPTCFVAEGALVVRERLEPGQELTCSALPGRQVLLWRLRVAEAVRKRRRKSRRI